MELSFDSSILHCKEALAVIRNLNQVSFRGFGMIMPDIRQSAIPELPVQWKLELTGGEIPVYRTRGETWLYGASGGAALSISDADGSYLHFYLDKPVRLNDGVTFYLSPMQRTSVVELTAQESPELGETLKIREDLSVRQRIQVNGIYTFFYQEREKGFFFPGEEHSMLELTYVDKGSLHSVVDGQDVLLKQGDMMIYGPNQWHVQYADVDVVTSFVTITFNLEGERLENLLDRKFSTPQRAMELLHQMLKERDEPDAYSEDMLISQLNQLLLVLLRQDGTAEQSKPRTGSAINSENEIIRRAQQYVGEHIREQLSVPIVARHADVSASYLTALFRKNLQISPGEYIRRIKLQESRQMIREGNLNFTEIAAALQYSTVHHFSRQFKEKFGITPTEYARSIR